MAKKLVKKVVEVEEEVDVAETVALEAAEEAAVAEVEAKQKAAADKRETDGVVETEDETTAREATEALELRVARGEVTKREQIHIDARNARIAAVKAAIEAARLERVKQEKSGWEETKGAIIDREAKEVKDLAEASVLKVVENFSIATTNNTDLNLITEKINEIVDCINGKWSYLEGATTKSFATQAEKDAAIQARKDAFAKLIDPSVAERNTFDAELVELENAIVTG